jgi:formate dehydrogenase subunit gamma
MGTAHETDDTPAQARIRAVVEPHRNDPGALLPVLHALSDSFGYVQTEAIAIVAEELNISQAEVYGVVTFYSDFRTEPPGRTVIRVCRAEACQSMGADALVAHATGRLGIGFGETTPDGAITLEQVFCLGNCALSPAVMVGDRLVGRVSAARFDELVTEGTAS